MEELPETEHDIAQWCKDTFVAKVQKRKHINSQDSRYMHFNFIDIRKVNSRVHPI